MKENEKKQDIQFLSAGQLIIIPPLSLPKFQLQKIIRIIIVHINKNMVRSSYHVGTRSFLKLCVYLHKMGLVKNKPYYIFKITIIIMIG